MYFRIIPTCAMVFGLMLVLLYWCVINGHFHQLQSRDDPKPLKTYIESLHEKENLWQKEVQLDKHSTEKLARPGQQSYDNTPSLSQEYPVVPHENNLPNFFTKLTPTERNSLRNQSIIFSFVHNQKSGGMTLRKCINKVKNDKGGRCLISDATILKFYDDISQGNIEESSILWYVGDAAFGICDVEINRRLPCTYFTILRDPYDRIVSAYEFCSGRGHHDLICRMWNVKNLTIEEFAIYTGSHLFRQLLYNIEICRRPPTSEEIMTSVHRESSHSYENLPCWYKQKAFLENLVNETHKMGLLSHITSNLENWFYVIGLTEEYGKSLEMLEQAYSLPFKLCAHDQQNANEDESYEGIKRTRRQQLLKDERVRQALYYDVTIYQEAVRIFKKQENEFFAYLAYNSGKE